MIDTDKYEGHTKHEDWKYYWTEGNGGDNWTMNNIKHQDALLLRDAPLLLQEVKRLREQLRHTDKYFGTGFGENKYYEVVWMHELDEENWDGVLGGGKDMPRPCFRHYEEAHDYCEQVRLKSRAIILEFRSCLVNEWDCWESTKWGEWGEEE